MVWVTTLRSYSRSDSAREWRSGGVASRLDWWDVSSCFAYWRGEEYCPSPSTSMRIGPVELNVKGVNSVESGWYGLAIGQKG